MGAVADGGMTSAERDARAYGVDIDDEWLAYGYGLYRDDGYRIFLDKIEPGDDEDSIEDWARHIREEYGENAAEAFEDFASRILRDPWPSKAEIRKRLIDVGVRHKGWPPEGQPDYEAEYA